MNHANQLLIHVLSRIIAMETRTKPLLFSCSKTTAGLMIPALSLLEPLSRGIFLENKKIQWSHMLPVLNII